MKISLAKALIERGIINNRTRIIARCPIVGLGNMPAEADLALNVDRAVFEDGTIKFLSTAKSGRRYSVPCEKVEEVDGMAPERLAAAYDIKSDGSKKTEGKKRGRKPKVNISSEEETYG
jgi:hypothetical protein